MGVLIVALLLANLVASISMRTVKAAERYQYELVEVASEQAPGLVSKRTADGWEPVSISSATTNLGHSGAVSVYVIFRK